MKKIVKFSKRKIGTGLFQVNLLIEINKHDFAWVEYNTHDSRAYDGYDGGSRALVIMCLRYNGYDESDYDLSNIGEGKE